METAASSISTSAAATNVNIKFTDEFGTVCVNEGSPVTVFKSTLTGEVTKDLLVASFNTAHCGPVQLKFLRGQTHGALP